MKPKINQLINKSVVRLKRGSPTVLTCLGVAGVVATTVSAVMATPKAIEKIRKDSLINHDGDPCGYSKTEAIRSAWVYYIPSTVIGVSTITCIVGANVLNRHQQASLSSAYALINKSYNEYKEKLKELYGEEAHQKIIDSSLEIEHSGVKGMKWGVRNGPPYPIKDNGRVAAVKKHDTIVEDAINSGEVIKTINKDKQNRHNKTQHIPGRSYLNGDTEYAQKLVDKYSGTGESKLDHNGKWNHRERIFADEDIGIYVDEQGVETPSNVGMIIYSNTGAHIYPARRKENK